MYAQLGRVAVLGGDGVFMLPHCRAKNAVSVLEILGRVVIDRCRCLREFRFRFYIHQPVFQAF